MPSWISPSSAVTSALRCLTFSSKNNGSTKQVLNITESYVRSPAAQTATTASSVAAINFTLKSKTSKSYMVKRFIPLQLLHSHKITKLKRGRLLNNCQTQFSCDVDSDIVICRSFQSSAIINQHTNVRYIILKSTHV